MVDAGSLIGVLTLLAIIPQTCGLCSTCEAGRCYDNGECIIGCLPGYVGKYCVEICPFRCLNKVCHFDRNEWAVTCTDGCEAGFCGIQCDLSCPEDCVTCDRECGSCNVTLCPEGRYGANCSEVCSPWCSKCDRETAQCIKCRRGYYGDECDQECTACLTRAEITMDKCLPGCDTCKSEETCAPGFHGDACKLPCSPGCANPGRGCNRATGECSNGCVSGYRGLTCTKAVEEDSVNLNSLTFLLPVVVLLMLLVIGSVLSVALRKSVKFLRNRRHHPESMDIQGPLIQTDKNYFGAKMSISMERWTLYRERFSPAAEVKTCASYLSESLSQ